MVSAHHHVQSLLAPQGVASSSPNMLSVVGHDLSDLQDNDDGREESVDDSDSEKGASSMFALSDSFYSVG
jgi:hypothetical protein